MAKIDKHIDDFKKIHGNLYSYLKSIYVDWNTKIEIICPIHGSFWQRISHHKKGSGCPKCNSKQKMTFESFLKKANTKWNKIYTYDKSTFINSQSNITAICKLHGKFQVNIQHHLRKKGQGCPVCTKNQSSIKKLSTKEKIVQKFNRKFPNTNIKFIGEYKGMHQKMKFLCPIHGTFHKTPSNFLKSKGCPKCVMDKHKKLLSKTKEQFIKESNKWHNNFYDYSEFDYINNITKGKIICPTHGPFWQTPQGHAYFGHSCPKCSNKISKGETEIVNFIKNLGVNVDTNNRKLIHPLEIDILIKDKKIGIEYNGLFFHREGIVDIKIGGIKDKNYHLNKTILMQNKGWELIHIFEDEWKYKKDILKSKIINILGKNKCEKIYARKCIIEEIAHKQCKEFLNKNHIQGSDNAGIRYGAFYDGDLVAVMTFLKNGDSKYKLNRFATDINYKVIGIGGKLLKYFERKYNPIEISTFADKRYTLDKENNLYIKLGFKLINETNPNYFYFNINEFSPKRESRVKYQKHKLLKKYPQYSNKTEKEIMAQLGYDRIYDCGNLKFIKTYGNTNQ